ncbi:MAG: V-type ATPase 116kDa subunit family protein [Bacteroidales bacterium]|nr:V-type ATPase 116kDa subunit family protein [Bacteroidales bacterium]
MQKFSFLVFHQDYTGFLEEVRRIGVVHLIEKQEDVSEEVRTKYDQIRQIQAMVKLLDKRKQADVSEPALDDGQAAFEKASELVTTLEEKYQQLGHLEKEISQVRPWGEFSKEIIQRLEEEELHIRFYSVATSRFDDAWLEHYPVEIIGQHAGLLYFVLVQQGNTEPDIDAEEMRPPERAVSELIHYKKMLEEDIQRINKEIDELAVTGIDAIKRYGYQIKETVDYAKALENTEKQAEDKVMLLEGWVPEEKKEALVSFLENTATLYIAQPPGQEDKVPILLKNKKFASKFEMLGDLYSLPSYRELDLTPFFAPFYVLFFGFCLGDAGYGILIALAALLLKKKVQKELVKVMGLVFYLGLSTFFFGVISGVFFGIPLFETGLPVYRDLALRFDQEGTDINMLLFNLSLVLGGIQIIFGLVLRAINECRQFGWKFAVGTAGWLLLILGGIGLYAYSRISAIPMSELRTALYVLLTVSGVLILFLNNMTRNIFMNFGVGLWNTYNMITGILGDMLSYIRLFALGISSAIMGYVFNSLAVEMSGNVPVISIIVMVVILLIGHSINIFMSGLGAFVHPMRLTFVEFYKNAGFTGGGKQYNPFKKIT